ncbi:SSI family serine proteinase inhibitor [Actinomadura bangladeshensis]|uniref:Serine protease n=1 Tax=Actinomadura bangladeshensis TaxID=453573 RepID=A0A4R4P7N6_9ACTN|nr:SSI family serine proteinase inhibitor [Actinomadura bangladeshensis]TDC16890.1 serine protease [Actinomadura bangladeshensis]
MHMSRARFRWAAVLAGMAAGASAAPAQAAGPAGSYVLTVVHELGPKIERSLHCDPDGGTLIQASRACDQLRLVDGRVERIPARTGVCTLEYAPVRVIARGSWHDRPRRFERTYPNRCVAVRETGGILFGG